MLDNSIRGVYRSEVTKSTSRSKFVQQCSGNFCATLLERTIGRHTTLSRIHGRFAVAAEENKNSTRMLSAFITRKRCFKHLPAQTKLTPYGIKASWVFQHHPGPMLMLTYPDDGVDRPSSDCSTSSTLTRNWIAGNVGFQHALMIKVGWLDSGANRWA